MANFAAHFDKATQTVFSRKDLKVGPCSKLARNNAAPYSNRSFKRAAAVAEEHDPVIQLVFARQT